LADLPSTSDSNTIKPHPSTISVSGPRPGSIKPYDDDDVHTNCTATSFVYRSESRTAMLHATCAVLVKHTNSSYSIVSMFRTYCFDEQKLEKWPRLGRFQDRFSLTLCTPSDTLQNHIWRYAQFSINALYSRTRYQNLTIHRWLAAFLVTVRLIIIFPIGQPFTTANYASKNSTVY